MPTIQVEAELSGPDLLKAVAQLEPAEFQEFVERVLTLRAERQAPCLSAPESELLLRINQGLPERLCRRHEELIRKRRDEALTSEEHAELLRLTEEVEQREGDRLGALTELARLRKTSLTALMNALGIRAPAHG